MRMLLILLTMLIASRVSTQTTSREKADKEAIEYAQKISVSSLDRNLPRVSLKFFLENESAGARIEWEVNDCGEQTGSPDVDRGRDFPMCVEAEVFLKDQRSLNVSVVVGTFKKGIVDKPVVWSVMLTENDGEVRSIALKAIPVELHRPEGKPKRDLPAPS